MLSQDELNKIRERAEKATKGTHYISFSDDYYVGGYTVGGIAKCIESGQDAEFLAAAYQDIPALLEHVAEVERELNEWRSLMIWGGTPERVDAFIKGQQIRIHECQNIERELEAAEAELARQSLARKEGV